MEEKVITEFENRFPGKIQKEFNLAFYLKKKKSLNLNAKITSQSI